MDWLYQNVRIIEQYVDQNGASRDKYMAENLLWIKDRNPGSKIVLWAHNGHIEKTGNSMGKYLSDTLGNDYLTIGFAFHNGHYTANGDKGLTRYEAQDSYIGTYEYFFNAINAPIFVLDLRNIKEKTLENSEWLLDKLEFRNVGANKMENEFSVTNLTQDFDLILFINESTSSTLLK
ncbi:MAG: erythromycin esterase family protein [Cyclobacteriaceae bacterium]